MYSGKRVFISGGAGVIGRELVSALQELGADILVGDLKPRPEDWAATVKYRQGDLNTLHAWEMRSFRPEYFFHLAATFERSTETANFWHENYLHNVALSHHLMSIMEPLDSLQRVIFASSYLIYNPDSYLFDSPQSEAVKLAENHEVNPRNLCGYAKFLHEHEVAFLSEFSQTGLTAVCARIYRSYGKNSRDIISRWIRSSIRGEPIELFRPEGLFDYIYAGDVAEGLLRLGASTVTGALNLGRGRSRTVQDVVDILATHFPTNEVRECTADIPFEASEADMSAFVAATGWCPATDLEQSIPLMIAHETTTPLAKREQPAVNVLMTSSANKAPCLREIRKALNRYCGGGRVIAADLNPDCITRYLADEFWQMPLLEEIQVVDLIAYCASREISVIVPTRDGELGWFARNRETLFSHGIFVMVSPSLVVELCFDKMVFAETLIGAGYPAIPTSEDLEAISASALVIKGRFGAGSVDLLLEQTRAEAASVLATRRDAIVQPHVEGREFSVDLYRGRHGEVKGVVVRERILVIDGESQVTTTVRREDIEKLCTDMAHFLGLEGHAVFQLLEDEFGKLHVIECNPRIGGASSLSLNTGLDSFLWLLMEAGGRNLDGAAFLPCPEPIQQIRYANDDFKVCTDL